MASFLDISFPLDSSGVSAPLQSGRYTLSYPRGRYYQKGLNFLLSVYGITISMNVRFTQHNSADGVQFIMLIYLTPVYDLWFCVCTSQQK